MAVEIHNYVLVHINQYFKLRFYHLTTLQCGSTRKFR